MAVTRCESCNGRKTVIGLGCMSKECPECYGVGFVTVKDEPVPVKRTRKKRSEPCPEITEEQAADLAVIQ